MRRGFLQDSIPLHPHVRNRDFLQRRHRAFSAIFLDETQQGEQQHDGQDGPGLLPLSQEPGNDRRADQDQDHGSSELLPQNFPRAASAFLFQLVIAIFGQALGRLRSRQALQR